MINSLLHNLRACYDYYNNEYEQETITCKRKMYWC